MKIAYFINQYPKVSHSFIRREILAMEAQGVEIMRMALRGWDAELADATDVLEKDKTRYVLQRGLLYLLCAWLATALRNPITMLKTLALAFRLSRNADRPLPYHFIYVAEAAVILRWMRRESIQHVHAHFGTNSAEVVMLAQALGGPEYSFTVHGPEEFDKPQAIALGEKIKQSKFVVAISSFGRSQLYRLIGHEFWNKVKVVHCGLEESFYNISEEIYPETPRLVCVGRLCEQKGQLLLLEAVHKVQQAGLPFNLVLAGDGEMRDEVELRIKEFGLQENVRITGWISSDQVREEILAARCMVLPSFAEGLPVVIMEAMALRRPVISTYVAGIPELIKPGVTGWLIPAGDVDTLARTIMEVLSTPTQKLMEMGRSSRNTVIERHDIHTEVRKLVQIMQGNHA